ncbi:MAG TPA: hypothetical protein VFF26_12165 [Gallionella sp.]|nr:hypothetical protein [Gallionella sp.]
MECDWRRDGLSLNGFFPAWQNNGVHFDGRSAALVLLKGYRIRRTESEQATPMMEKEIKLQPYWKILAGNLLFGGVVLFLCSFSVFTVFFAALVVAGVLLPMAFSARNKSRELRLQRWTRLVIYAIAVTFGWLLDHQAGKDEQRNFDNVIAAVEQYKAAEQRYPNTLEQLVPKYLSSVPPGRWGKFTYDAQDSGNTHLSHMPAPFIHESYDFKSRTRRTWD